MKAERWQQIKAILEPAFELSSETRPGYLQQACDGDLELLAEVESFIARQPQAQSFLEGDAIDVVDISLADGLRELAAGKLNNNITDDTDYQPTLSQALDQNNDAAAEPPEDSGVDPLIKRRLGDFIIEERLGSGGFGTIYRAVQPLLNREAVIKIIKQKKLLDPTYQELFVREARLASRLEHPYTTSIYAFGAEPDNLLWIAMEYVRGVPLSQLLQTQGPLPLAEFIPLFNKICEVVQTAHDCGIIHRDLKPANVMVISRAGRLLPKLLDFGIAKSLAGSTEINHSSSNARSAEPINVAGATVSHLELSGDNGVVDAAAGALDTVWASGRDSGRKETIGVGGSPGYMAPEQWQPGGQITAQTDIYALGVLCYEALTGHRPFQGDVYSLYLQHRYDPMPPMGQGWSIVVEQTIAKALAKQPEDRYCSATEFAACLQDATGLLDDLPGLIPLDEVVRESLLAGAPQPIAEAVAELATARNLYQAREQMLEVVRACLHYLATVTLAVRAKTIAADNQSASNITDSNNRVTLELLEKLRRGHLSELEWLTLARELVRPAVANRAAYPIPSLVNFFFPLDDDQPAELPSGFTALLELSQLRITATNYQQSRRQLNQLMASLSELLKALLFLNDYRLIAPQPGGYAECWMGNHLRSIRSEIKAKLLSPGQPVLLDSDGDIVLSLWPFAQIAEPTPGARAELFLLEGYSDHGAKLIALPSSFTLTSAEIWPYFDQSFAINARERADAAIVESPYLGLATFEPNDAARYFGREKETEYFLNRLLLNPLLVLAGPSGAGKSSFIQAGVIPRLENCRVITIRPGATPLVTLVTRLIKEGCVSADLQPEALNDPEVLGNCLRTGALLLNVQIVLIIDQLEELFTICANQRERERFAESLALAARDITEPIRVICTVRDDFLLRARTMPGLGQRLTQGLELLTTPSLDNLVRILVEPARRAGYQFADDQLPIEMAQSLLDRQMALALLSFAAARLWELRDEPTRQLTRAAYQQMGGVGGALSEHAERVYHQMSTSERHTTREIFRQLVTNQGTRAVLTRQELTQLLDNPAAERVIESLIRARLLSAYENDQSNENIEVVHEALLTAWPRLVKWQQEDTEGTRLRDQLREAVRQWQERGQPKGLLWRDETLAELRLWRARYPGRLIEPEQAFIEASNAEATRMQRRRRLLYIVAIAVLIIALGAAFTINHRIEQQLLESYLDKGRSELLSGRPMQAAVYFNEVYQQGVDNLPLRIMLGQAMNSVDVKLVAAFGGKKVDINCSVFSPDGRKIGIASDDQTAQVWDIATSRQLSLLKHNGLVASIAFSHDSRLLATASSDGKVRLWDANSNQLLRTYAGHSGLVRSVIFSSDDKRLLSGSEDKSIIIWDVKSGDRLVTIAEDGKFSYRSPVFSPDDSRVLVGCSDNNARVYDAATGKLLQLINGHAAVITTAVYSRDGRKIATASDDQTAKIWEAASGKLLLSLTGHNNVVNGVDFSVDGNLIVTAGSDKSIKLWNANNGQLITSLELHTGYIWSVHFNPDATQIVTHSYDGTAKVWDISRFKAGNFTEIVRLPIGIASVEYSPDGRYILAAGGGNKLLIIDAETRTTIRTIDLFSAKFNFIRSHFSPDGRRIVTSSYYNTEAFSRGDISASFDKAARVWDSETGQLLFNLTGHDRDVIEAIFSPDGRRIVTSSFDKTAKVWDANTGALLFTLKGHTDNVGSCRFSSDNRMIVTASNDGSVKIWNADNGQLMHTLIAHSMPLHFAIFTPDNRRVITASTDATAKIIDIATGQVIASLNGNAGDVRYCSISPDGSLIAMATGDGKIILWDAVTSKMVLSLNGHKYWANAVIFSRDQRYIITSGTDGRLVQWELPQELRTPAEIDKLIEERVPYRFENGQLIPRK